MRSAARTRRTTDVGSAPALGSTSTAGSPSSWPTARNQGNDFSSYLPKYASSFRNSYDEFWEKFSAESVSPQAYRLPLPLELRDLSELKSKHRSRAEARRRAWGEVGRSAGAALASHLRGASRAVPAQPAAGLTPQSPTFCAAAVLADWISALPSALPLA